MEHEIQLPAEVISKEEASRRRKNEVDSFSEAKLAKQKEQKDDKNQGKAIGGKPSGIAVQLFNRLAKKVRR